MPNVRYVSFWIIAIKALLIIIINITFIMITTTATTNTTIILWKYFFNVSSHLPCCNPWPLLQARTIRNRTQLHVPEMLSFFKAMCFQCRQIEAAKKLPLISDIEKLWQTTEQMHINWKENLSLPSLCVYCMVCVCVYMAYPIGIMCSLCFQCLEIRKSKLWVCIKLLLKNWGAIMVVMWKCSELIWINWFLILKGEHVILKHIFIFLDVSPDMVLKQFGEYFFEFCKQSGYDHMLRTLGGNLYEFIENLDALHSYLSLSYQASGNEFYKNSREIWFFIMNLLIFSIIR